jgi:hypothetical protein
MQRLVKSAAQMESAMNPEDFIAESASEALLQDACKALRADVAALRKALSFYADPTRYHGPNQPLEVPDEWSASVGLGFYRLDVTRDQGVIARTALGAA